MGFFLEERYYIIYTWFNNWHFLDSLLVVENLALILNKEHLRKLSDGRRSTS
jgi:hypothetical protein